MAHRNRFDQLADETICQILAHLPTKDAVATTVLGRCWSNLWTFLSKVNVDDSSIALAENMVIDQELSFYRFVYRVLRDSMPTQPLQKFALKCNTYTRAEIIKHIVQVSLVQRDVRELHVLLDLDEMESRIELPEELCRRPCLQMLTLGGVKLNVPSGPSFPSLKTLLVDISNSCDLSMLDFYSRCPILEELLMEGKVSNVLGNANPLVFNVNSKSLKTLNIKLEAEFDFVDIDDHELADDDGRQMYEFEINTPNLQCLDINDDILANYSVKNLDSLEDARVQAGRNDFRYGNTSADFLNDMVQLLKGLTKCRALTLYDHSMGALGFAFHREYLDANDNDDTDNDHNDAEEEGNKFNDETLALRIIEKTFPEFSQVTYLKLCIANCHGWNLLPYVLIRTPNLEILDIEMVIRSEVDLNERFVWNPPENKPICLTTKIKMVRIKEVQGYEVELARVRGYFLDI